MAWYLRMWLLCCAVQLASLTTLHAQAARFPATSYKRVTDEYHGVRSIAARALPTVLPNPNIERAGVLHDGVLTIELEARASAWELNGPDRAPMTIEAFSEPDKRPRIPGPLVRAPLGTEIHLSVRNALPTALTVFIPEAIHGGPIGGRANDSVVVLPGATGRLTTRATVPGSYVYRATMPTQSLPSLVTGLLAGAIVIDTAGTIAPPRDRVLVLMASMDSVLRAEANVRVVNLNAPALGRLIFTINGRSWPNTERIAATVGDSLHWRIINASADYHPMHLHGFYYHVDAIANPGDDPTGQDGLGRFVVTQIMPPLSAMSMTWSPDRPGNWIFHCHFALHLMPDSISAAPDDPYRRGMVGLVLEINVAERPGSHAAGAPSPRRHLRLIAIADTVAGANDVVPSMRFVLEEGGRRIEARPWFSPDIDLTRGEPVSIMVVNHLTAPTSVHWHGIELENAYVDGVPGVSGAGTHLAPAIAPGDSFEAQFTPPRSGTFMYHAHVDEVREQQAGLEGALIVRDPGTAPLPDEHVFFLTGPRLTDRSRFTAATQSVEINGAANPDTIILHAGRPARLRVLSLATANPTPVVSLTARPDSEYTLAEDDDTTFVRLRKAFRAGEISRDSLEDLLEDKLVVQWQIVAKDGSSLAGSSPGLRAARQRVSIGETYDFAYLPERRGELRIEVRLGPLFRSILLARVPIRVE